MSLITLPTKILERIKSYLQPAAPSFPSAHLPKWSLSFTPDTRQIRVKARDFIALLQSYRGIRNKLWTYSGHVHVEDFNIRLIKSVMRLPNIQSLSTNSLALLEYEITVTNGHLKRVEAFMPQCIKSSQLSNIDTINTSILSLYRTNGSTSAEYLSWFLKKLPSLSTFRLAFKCPRPQEIILQLSIEIIVRLLRKFNRKLEHLVLTRYRQPYEEGNIGWREGIHLGKLSHLPLLQSLTSLRIGTDLLLEKKDGAFDNGTDVSSLLPASLVELDIYYDDFPFYSSLYTVSVRPRWLFRLLENKATHSAHVKLERLRISSLEFVPAFVDEPVGEVWNGEYEAHPYDYDSTSEDGYGSWLPPIELIKAFKKAKLSFGVFVYPVSYRKIVRGGTWFADSTEDDWPYDKNWFYQNSSYSEYGDILEDSGST